MNLKAPVKKLFIIRRIYNRTTAENIDFLKSYIALNWSSWHEIPSSETTNEDFKGFFFYYLFSFFLIWAASRCKVGNINLFCPLHFSSPFQQARLYCILRCPLLTHKTSCVKKVFVSSSSICKHNFSLFFVKP